MPKYLWVISILAVTAACDRGPVATTESVDEAVESVSPDPATPAEDLAVPPVTNESPSATATTTDGLSGNWEVVGVVPLDDSVSVYGKNDPLILKSRMKIDRDKLSWPVSASDDFTVDDTCKNPKTIALSAADSSGDIQKQMSAAIARLGQKSSASKIYKWSCDGDGNWGPDADGGSYFVILENGQMVAGWYDNVALLLRR